MPFSRTLQARDIDIFSEGLKRVEYPVITCHRQCRYASQLARLPVRLQPFKRLHEQRRLAQDLKSKDRGFCERAQLA